MAGGLIQLVAYGLEDLYLTKDPQITFFKIVYRRHTNFSTEVIPQFFLQTPNFGKRVTSVLSRNGDLIRKVHLVVTLPSIPQFKDEDGNIDVITKFAWVRRIGYAIINSIEIEIGNELIDKQYGDWLNIWHELTIPNNKDLSKILGDVQELTEFTNGKQSYKLFIPLKFWFNRFTGIALPVISLQYNNVKINLELRPFDECHIVAPTHFISIDNDLVNFENFEFIEQTVNGVTSLARFMYFDILNKRLYLWRLTNNGFQSVSEADPENVKTEQQRRAILYAKDADGQFINQAFFIRGLSSGFEAMPQINSVERVHKNRSVNFKNILIKEAFLLVEYIFLDTEERVRFYQARHEYLIEQVEFNGEKVLDSINQSFKIGFSHPCKELQWVSQLTLFQNTRVNDLFNYTDSLLRNSQGDLVGNNIIVAETILFNGHERISMRESQYFTQVQPYQYHRHSPQKWINVYSFSLHPEKHQPASAANFSKIDNAVLKLSINPKIDFVNTAKLRIYGLMNNILRIANGISGLVFANDRKS
jgi:hypothetical protein